MPVLSHASFLFWRHPNVTRSELVLLFSGTSVWVILCKSASFGFDAPSEIVAGIVANLAALFLLEIASLVAVFVNRNEEPVAANSYKIAKTFAVIWFFSLFAFSINCFPDLRWFDRINSSTVVSCIHTGLAVLVVLAISFREYRECANDELRLAKISIAVGAAACFLTNVVAFKTLILEPETHYWIIDNNESLIRALGM